MDLELAGKVVVVTGASKGIGYACAEAFVREGARVALVSRSQQNLDAALARLPRGAHAPIAIVADLVQAHEAARMVVDVTAAFGEVDVLVNSAGAAKRYPPDELGPDAWQERDGRQVLQLHPSDRRPRQTDGGARFGRHREHHRHRAARRRTPSTCRAAARTPR